MKTLAHSHRNARLLVAVCCTLSLPFAASAQTFDVLDIDITPRRSSSLFTFPAFDPNTKLTATFGVVNGVDPWDRAANFYIEEPNGDRIEIMKSVTGFGGTSTHTRDITHLLPRLSGKTVRIGGFVDAWTGDAWHLDGAITATAQPATSSPVFVKPVISEARQFAGYFDEPLPDGTLGHSHTVQVPELPEGIEEYESLKLYYFTSGHSGSDGRGGNEFVTDQHRIFVNGAEVDNYTADNNQAVDGYEDELGLTFGKGPGTYNVEDFRVENSNVTTGYQNSIANAVLNNPDTSGDPKSRLYTTREVYFPWRQFGHEYIGNNQGGGTHQYARSGWKPGDSVQAATIDVTDLMTTGENTVTLSIGGGDFTNDWRFSAYLVGELPTDSLVYTGSPLDNPADLNQDGQVNQADVDHFVAAFNAPVNPLYGFYDPSDLDGNGAVDLDDAFAFHEALVQKGMQLSFSQITQTVPEPATYLSALALAATAVFVSQRRKLLVR
ncbi:hypothetical protein NG895_30045 [Aeoliella sp. ICT_H6.2]|uniref:Peptide-N-glycosidase F C-terminal domain-containing protein n=1 Tax=Aeoliella straminimaris TaxID=2954799 RepID=A0A9X2FGU7_9BACT|nr:peptide-N-glycosidase F-related protein [Aeoliella straminimaris]MCO6048158.1 hypothetical protein [Aeoliella straminimaris]